ncbi:conserved protein of unknown function [Tenacibaculum sp. 190130A14a]|uniref:Uncharacterized protein n=1 Tax=Tenacibaculum polynesiense TaxID=3137857 RepID=A0ABM9PD42_9FLAO
MNTNLAMVATPNATTQGEDTKYDKVKITNGYGLISKAGVSVQRGITAHLHVDMNTKTLTENTVKSWLEDNKSSFTQEQWSSVSQGFSASGAFGWLFGGSAGYYRNTNNKIAKAQTEQQKGFLKSLYQQQETNVNIHGTLDAVGTSFIPVEGFVFVEVTTITFDDNTSLNVINSSNSTVADSSGSTNGIEKTGGNLNVVPLK